MFEKIIEKIESLPTLPQTVIDLQNFKRNPNYEISDLIKIIEKDAFYVATLLKISNSSLFGFNSTIDTVSRAIDLLGINFTIFVAIKAAINNTLECNLYAYGIKCDDFMNITNKSLRLVNLWLSSIDIKLRDEVLLAILLQESGKFVLSEIVTTLGITKEFSRKLKVDIDTVKVERELIGITTSEITAQLFKHWKLSKKLIETIEFVDNLEKCNEEYKRQAQVLNIIKTIFDVSNVFTEKSIEKGLEKAIAYNMYAVSLNSAINSLKNNFDDDL